MILKIAQNIQNRNSRVAHFSLHFWRGRHRRNRRRFLFSIMRCSSSTSDQISATENELIIRLYSRREEIESRTILGRCRRLLSCSCRRSGSFRTPSCCRCRGGREVILERENRLDKTLTVLVAIQHRERISRAFHSPSRRRCRCRSIRYYIDVFATNWDFLERCYFKRTFMN